MATISPADWTWSMSPRCWPEAAGAGRRVESIQSVSAPEGGPGDPSQRARRLARGGGGGCEGAGAGDSGLDGERGRRRGPPGVHRTPRRSFLGPLARGQQTLADQDLFELPVARLHDHLRTGEDDRGHTAITALDLFDVSAGVVVVSNVDLVVLDVVLAQKALGAEAVCAPPGGVHSDPHRIRVLRHRNNFNGPDPNNLP